MKKQILFIVCLISCTAIFAQTEENEGDEMAAANNYSGAAMMYRLCIELDQKQECSLKLIRLLYEEKTGAQSANELFQLVNPIAEDGNAEVQYYLGMMYSKGFGVEQDDARAIKWLQSSADQGNTAAQEELILLNPSKQAKAVPQVNNNRGRTAPKDESSVVSPTRQASAVSRERETASRSNTDINNRYQQGKGSSKTSGILFAVGGACIVGGAAATYLLPPKITEDWTNSDETGTYIEVKKRNPIFLIAGGVVGGVCIGAGIILKKKGGQPKNFAYEYNPSQPVSRPNNDMRLDLVAVGNGAGFRLTF